MKIHAPITGEQIAEMLRLGRPTIRSDLSVLVMLGHIDAKPKVGYFLGRTLKTEGEIESKLRQLKVREILGVPVIVSDTASVHDAVITLFTEDVGSLIVTNGQQELVGIVSRKDLLKVTLGSANLNAIPVRMVMTRSPQIVSVFPDDPILEAARKLLRHQINCLPVIQRITDSESTVAKYEVIGRVTKTNILNILVDMTLE